MKGNLLVAKDDYNKVLNWVLTEKGDKPNINKKKLIKYVLAVITSNFSDLDIIENKFLFVFKHIRESLFKDLIFNKIYELNKVNYNNKNSNYNIVLGYLNAISNENTIKYFLLGREGSIFLEKNHINSIENFLNLFKRIFEKYTDGFFLIMAYLNDKVYRKVMESKIIKMSDESIINAYKQNLLDGNSFILFEDAFFKHLKDNKFDVVRFLYRVDNKIIKKNNYEIIKKIYDGNYITKNQLIKVLHQSVTVDNYNKKYSHRLKNVMKLFDLKPKDILLCGDSSVINAMGLIDEETRDLSMFM